MFVIFVKHLKNITRTKTDHVYMENRILTYVVALIAVFSLQSCVTNYVVSKPTLYTEQYKTNAKSASLDAQKIESAKKQLVSNFNTAQTQLKSVEE